MRKHLQRIQGKQVAIYRDPEWLGALRRRGKASAEARFALLAEFGQRPSPAVLLVASHSPVLEPSRDSKGEPGDPGTAL